MMRKHRLEVILWSTCLAHTKSWIRLSVPYKPGVALHTSNGALEKQRQEDQEFEASLGYKSPGLKNNFFKDVKIFILFSRIKYYMLN